MISMLEISLAFILSCYIAFRIWSEKQKAQRELKNTNKTIDELTERIKEINKDNKKYYELIYDLNRKQYEIEQLINYYQSNKNEEHPDEVLAEIQRIVTNYYGEED